jgi:hydroxymethylglutaryl-CoA lyase
VSDIVFQEVSPRDGLQIEATFVATDDKIRLIDGFSTLGFSRIEVSSFVSPKAVPALADAADVFAGIRRNPDVVYVALVPNLRGAERALQAGADELNLVASASDTHNLANMGMTGDKSFDAFAGIVDRVRGTDIRLNGTVATAFGCPFEGDQGDDKILGLVRRHLDLGMGGITLADTTGMADPAQVERLVGKVLALVPAERLTLHFHDTRGLGLANVLAAHRAGARRFDGSLGGLGGCPFAPGASGNICTEDAVAMAERMGLATGIDLPGLIAMARTLPALLGHDVPGQIMKAGLVTDLHAAPVGGSA